MRHFAIQKPADLKNAKWLFVYDYKHGYYAESVLGTLKKSSGLLGIKIEDPKWIEIQSFNSTDDFECQVDEYIEKNGTPTIALLMLP